MTFGVSSFLLYISSATSSILFRDLSLIGSVASYEVSYGACGGMMEVRSGVGISFLTAGELGRDVFISVSISFLMPSVGAGLAFSTD